MPEQPQWPERTLDMPPQDPWADPPTTDMPPRGAAPQYDPRSAGTAYPGTADPTRHQGASDATRHQGAADATRHYGSAADTRHTGGVANTGQAAPQGRAAATPPAPPSSPFTSGRAAVNPRPQPQQFVAEHEPTGTGWPGAAPPAQQQPLSWHLAQLRRGGEWSFAGLLFAFVCWGVWAMSSDGKLTTPIVVFLVSVAVAGGVFAMSRLVGRIVLERQFGRVRRTARGSHMVAGLFLVGVGIAHLGQTDWVVNAVDWVVELFR
ncbi:DNA-directed RNA polymerase II [Actinoplanes sp. NPDC051859]|uniref:DNA-directed RNA polymerase II n=1 Tax=Actinoplanes sp. NPDC051859 TaxID=3363909 RepID=UPI0037ACE90F